MCIHIWEVFLPMSFLYLHFLLCECVCVCVRVYGWLDGCIHVNYLYVCMRKDKKKIRRKNHIELFCDFPFTLKLTNTHSWSWGERENEILIDFYSSVSKIE